MTDRTDEFDGRPELVKKRAQTIIVQRIAIGVAVMFVATSLTLLVLNAIASTQSRSILLDCTQPTGECAQRGQEQTAALLKKLIDSGTTGDANTQRIVLLAAACAEEYEIKNEPDQDRRISLLESCVNDQLKEIPK